MANVNEVAEVVEAVANEAADNGIGEKIVKLVHSYDIKNCAIAGIALGAGVTITCLGGMTLFEKVPEWHAKRKLKKAEKKAAKEAKKASEAEEPTEENDSEE